MKGLKCNECNFWAPNRQRLRRHLKRKHNVDLDLLSKQPKVDDNQKKRPSPSSSTLDGAAVSELKSKDKAHESSRKYLDVDDFNDDDNATPPQSKADADAASGRVHDDRDNDGVHEPQEKKPRLNFASAEPVGNLTILEQKYGRKFDIDEKEANYWLSQPGAYLNTYDSAYRGKGDDSYGRIAWLALKDKKGRAFRDAKKKFKKLGYVKGGRISMESGRSVIFNWTGLNLTDVVQKSPFPIPGWSPIFKKPEHWKREDDFQKTLKDGRYQFVAPENESDSFYEGMKEQCREMEEAYERMLDMPYRRRKDIPDHEYHHK